MTVPIEYNKTIIFVGTNILHIWYNCSTQPKPKPSQAKMALARSVVHIFGQKLHGGHLQFLYESENSFFVGAPRSIEEK